MRLFEVLLLVSNIGLLALATLLKKGRRRIPVFVASGTATLLLVIHGMVEGYRALLIFPYCITILFLAISIHAYFNKAGPLKIPRFLLGSAYTVMAIVLVVTTGYE
ncbi:hypothetical protein GCM10010912_48790 [Paenibacillus albidus]|uniref:Uncharacterized protein n=1 Tax=Paenibacillus albidus TaxID=2041023 RepID=A0A917CU30_9BACL|nr:hypothetical protein [Paenibacillus albidus]GGF98360.1 hypothetical protein GCM10010912_48790 [Paenibacillus albidus]